MKLNHSFCNSTNGLFLIVVKVGRGTNSEMSPQLIGAVVPVTRL